MNAFKMEIENTSLENVLVILIILMWQCNTSAAWVTVVGAV